MNPTWTVFLQASTLWIPLTVAAAAAQTARNAMQRQLSESIGTSAATQSRFLYAFPFSICFLALFLVVTGEALPELNFGFLVFITIGAVTQILATALMLAAMKEKSFSLVTAYTKTEPVQVALFGFVVLGDSLSPVEIAAIVIATAGVMLAAFRPGTIGSSNGNLRALFLGIVAGAFFALAAIGYRGAILSLDDGSFFLRSTVSLVCGIGMQTALLCIWQVSFDRQALDRTLSVWRMSVQAGFYSALASLLWFLSFSLTTAANVRTVALVEVFFAAIVSYRVFAQKMRTQELMAMGLIAIGIGLLVSVHR
ncbi:DMT family transporter [Ensifer sp. ENS04]|uniref:DMT family transporter n=1 Tax=Ensifer sp. ENS04 TaxID=2769281 RepID=UPI001782F2D0|nr:DMT family transporter [Ensifer sp. ENS04]MBD9541479.1 DMT family transporter [Ensifer sp. ENS04]